MINLMNEVLSERHLAKEVKRWGKCWACGGEKSRQDLSSLMCKNSRIWGKANVCLWLSGKHLFDVLLRCSAKQETQQCLAGVAAKQDDFLLVLGLQKTTLTVYFLAFTKYIFFFFPKWFSNWKYSVKMQVWNFARLLDDFSSLLQLSSFYKDFCSRPGKLLFSNLW